MVNMLGSGRRNRELLHTLYVYPSDRNCKALGAPNKGKTGEKVGNGSEPSRKKNKFPQRKASIYKSSSLIKRTSEHRRS